MLASSALSPAETERLTRRGLRLAQFTVAYNVIEGVVAVAASVTNIVSGFLITDRMLKMFRERAPKQEPRA